MYKDRRDLYFTSEGDLMFDNDTEDLKDTQNIQMRALLQQCLTRVMSTRGDWPLQPNIGASVGDFLGAANSRATADAIKNRINSELVREGLLQPGSIKTEIVPVDRNKILILLLVVPPGSSQALQLSFSYSFSENKLVPRNI